MARYPWMNMIDIGEDEYGMPTQPVASIVRPSEPVDNGQIAAATQQIIGDYLMGLSNPEAQADAAVQQEPVWQPPQQGQQQAQQPVGQEDMPPPALPPVTNTLPMQTNNVQTNAPAPNLTAMNVPQIADRSQTPSVLAMPDVQSFINSRADNYNTPAVAQQQPPLNLPPESAIANPVSTTAGGDGTGNFLQDLAYSSFGNAYTPWKRNETGQWNPDRGASTGDRLGTLIGSLARASAGLRFNPGGGGSFGYDPYAGSYLTRQRNAHLMNTGRMNDQYDPDIQAAIGQAAGAREAARRSAAGYPAQMTPEQELDWELETIRRKDMLQKELDPDRYLPWTEQLERKRQEAEMLNELRQGRDDPMEQIKMGFGWLKDFRENPTPENYWIAANAVGPKDDGTLYSKDELFKVTDSVFGNTIGTGVNSVASDDYPAAAEALNFSMGITPENTEAMSQAQKTLNFINQLKDQPISPIVMDKVYGQAEKEIAPTSWYHPQRNEKEIKAIEKYNESVGREVPVWQYRPGLRLYNDPYYREAFDRMMGRETYATPEI